MQTLMLKETVHHTLSFVRCKLNTCTTIISPIETVKYTNEIFCRHLSLQMPFFQSKNKNFYNQVLGDLTLEDVALGKPYYLPYIYTTEESVTRVSQYSCYLYLNLLTRFINFTKGLSEHELKVYLVRAEYRYFRFISFVGNDSPAPLGMFF